MVFLFIFFSTGCDSSLGLESYGLKLLHLRIDRDSLSQLVNSGLQKSPVSAVLDVDKTVYPVEVSYAGNSSIKNLKKNFEVDFILDSYNQHKFYKISSHSQDTTLLKGVLGAFILERLDLIHSEIEPASLYINREFFGLYVFLEPVDYDYFARRGLRIYQLYKAKVQQAGFDKVMITDPEFGFKSKFGGFNRLAIGRLAQLAHQEIGPDHKRELNRYIDVREFIKFVATAVLMQNFDTFNNNYFIYQTSRSPLFHFIYWDWDMTYKSSNDDLDTIEQNILNRNKLVLKVLEYPEYLSLYQSEINQALNGPLQVSDVLQFVDEQAALIERAYNADRFLGREGTLNFLSEKDRMKSIIQSWFAHLNAKY